MMTSNKRKRETDDKGGEDQNQDFKTTTTEHKNAIEEFDRFSGDFEECGSG
jgi:hypothetical protein